MNFGTSRASAIEKLNKFVEQNLNLFNKEFKLESLKFLNTPILDMYHDAIMQTANLSTFANCISVTSFILQVSFGDSGYTKI